MLYLILELGFPSDPSVHQKDQHLRTQKHFQTGQLQNAQLRNQLYLVHELDHQGHAFRGGL